MHWFTNEMTYTQTMAKKWNAFAVSIRGKMWKQGIFMKNFMQCGKIHYNNTHEPKKIR